MKDSNPVTLAILPLGWSFIYVAVLGFGTLLNGPEPTSLDYVAKQPLVQNYESKNDVLNGLQSPELFEQRLGEF